MHQQQVWVVLCGLKAYFNVFNLIVCSLCQIVVVKPKRKVATKKNIDFNAPPIDVKRLFAPPPRSKLATQLTSAAQAKARQNMEALLLPQDMHFSVLHPPFDPP